LKTSVVDASALVRIFTGDGPIPEGLEAAIAQADRGDGSLLAPELIWVEAGQALHRIKMRGQISEKEFTDLWSDMATIPIESVRHRELLEGAFELAAEEKLSVYDASYLALALRTGSFLFTADDRLGEAANRHGYRKSEY